MSKYVTKAELLEYCKVQRPNLVVDDIPDIIINIGEKKVDIELSRLKLFPLPTKNDSNSFLKYSASCFILMLLAQDGIIRQFTGNINEERFRDVRYSFQRGDPMFFFATGTSKPFMELLPNETLRMLAYSFIRGYADWRFYKDTGHKYPQIKIGIDHTSRGAYWNRSNDEIDSADARYGDILQ